ncbi:hypothetical protein HUO09_17855 [Vibrio sp. Y2-5]|uniref:hypothetical protein n=1 Tax=Vibrio sp. Y2-5 TaxID=2743977 RepID=UPI0016605ABA|nr:hypothetical protein [Vibrio sp. Y2-5]MBD0788224.1 hypothetical protein [Vibrio sp. Y2-5]
MATVAITERFFQIGSAKIKDQFPQLPFEKAIEFLSKQYPQIRHTRMYEADAVAQEDGSLLYEVPLLKVATNG